MQKLYSDYCGESVLKTLSDGSTLCGAEGQDGLFASAVQDGDKIYVKVVNTTDKASNICLNFKKKRKAAEPRAVEMVQLRSDDLYSDNDLKNPEKYSPVRKPFEYTPGSDLICEPYSFNIYIFSLK